MEKKQPKFEPINKPLSVVRHEVINTICFVLNNSNLPVFVKVELLERILAELRPCVETEYQRDLETFNATIKGDEK